VKKYLLAVSVAMLVFAGLTIAVQQSFTRYGFGGADLVPLWLGGRALLFERISPYSSVVTLRSQEAILGGPAAPGADQFAFAYPLIALFPALPVFFLPFATAEAAWLVAAMMVNALATIGVAQKASLRTMLLLGLGSLLFYPSVRALALGQYSPIVLGFIGAAMLAIRFRAERTAGAALAFACCKPQMTFLIVPALLLWGLRTRRKALLVSFVLTTGILGLASLLWWPDWVGEWLTRLGEYHVYTPQAAPLDVLLGPWAPAGTALLAITALMVVWFAQHHEVLADWLIPITLLVAPASSVSDQVLLLLPVTHFASRLALGWRTVLIAAVVALPWLWFFVSQANGRETAAMVWPMPLAVLGGLVCSTVVARFTSRRLS
jgi:Glycosyltransferase family 87